MNVSRMGGLEPYQVEGLTLSPHYTNIQLSERQDVNTTSAVNDLALSAAQAGQLNSISYWINGVMTNIVVLLGLIGNLLTIIILSQRVMRSSTNIYLSALAVWDSIVLICTALLIGLPGIPVSGPYMAHVHAFIVSYIYPLALIAQTATIWLTVSFTVERYIAVCHPLKAATMCTISRAKIVIFGVSLGSTMYNIPRWYEYRPSWHTNKETNETYVDFVSTVFSTNPTYVQVYFSWLYVPIMCIIPLLTLSIMNLFLILAVRRSQQQQKNMNVKQSRENNVTIMLVSVVIVFIICQVPALVYNLAYAVDRQYVQEKFGYQVLSVFRNFLVCFNSSINFLLYCALGQKFRRIFLQTFCRRCVNERYIPMSGVHNPTTMTHMPSQRRFTTLHQVRTKIATDTSCSHENTTATTSTVPQETGTLLVPNNLSPKRVNGDREVHTYAALRERMHQPRTLSSHMDSDEEVTYDMCLLPDADKDLFPLYRTDLRQSSNAVPPT